MGEGFWSFVLFLRRGEEVRFPLVVACVGEKKRARMPELVQGVRLKIACRLLRVGSNPTPSILSFFFLLLLPLPLPFPPSKHRGPAVATVTTFCYKTENNVDVLSCCFTHARASDRGERRRERQSKTRGPFPVAISAAVCRVQHPNLNATRARPASPPRAKEEALYLVTPCSCRAAFARTQGIPALPSSCRSWSRKSGSRRKASFGSFSLALPWRWPPRPPRNPPVPWATPPFPPSSSIEASLPPSLPHAAPRCVKTPLLLVPLPRRSSLLQTDSNASPHASTHQPVEGLSHSLTLSLSFLLGPLHTYLDSCRVPLQVLLQGRGPDLSYTKIGLPAAP